MSPAQIPHKTPDPAPGNSSPQSRASISSSVKSRSWSKESFIFSFGLAEDLLSCSSLCLEPRCGVLSSMNSNTGNPGNELSPLSLSHLLSFSQLREWVPVPGLLSLPSHTHVPSGEVSAIWISLGFEIMSSSGSPLSMSLRLKMITSVPREQKSFLCARCPQPLPTPPVALELQILGNAGSKPTYHCLQESS